MGSVATDDTENSVRKFQDKAIGMATQLQQVCDAIQNKLQPITDQMYKTDKNNAMEKLFTTIEEKTNVKREKLVYGTIAFLMIYFIIGALAQIISNVVGFVYPAYRSIKAVRSSVKEDDTQWLIYWIVFAWFSIVDFSVFSTVPFYWLFKVVFLLYLHLPVFNGATVIYHNFIDPACTFVESYFHPSEPKKTN
ncbi:hypothetical protein RB195_008358 [Necator americanus]|uniref:Receptor expression-enhancing protein n=1 Tax=Necator americanus TaxID=51031 RepID=A0ABR1CN91_NECAM